MQSTGQGATQSTQPMHQGSTTVCMSCAAPTMASTGQASMHSVHPIQRLSSITATASRFIAASMPVLALKAAVWPPCVPGQVFVGHFAVLDLYAGDKVCIHVSSEDPANKRQNRPLQREAGGARGRRGHVGDAVVHYAFLDVDRRAVRSGARGLRNAALVDTDIDQCRARPHP